MPPFVPLLFQPHLLTVLAHYWPRKVDEHRFPVERIVHESEPGGRVMILVQRPGGAARGNLVLLHGLEGSSQAGYMVSMAATALGAGFSAHRLNFRSCGGTESLSDTMYHGGLTIDVHSYIRTLEPPVFLIGYSLGANVALKLAGELGSAGPGLLAGVCAISTPLDLAECVERLGVRENRLYERRFVQRMKERLGNRNFDGLAGLKSIRDIDEKFTAPAFGFRDASDYYQTQSSIHFLASIRVPALLIQAQDDPLIPFHLFEQPVLRGNPNLKLVAPEHGGHLGFLSRRQLRHWDDAAVLEWIERLASR